MGFNQCRNYVLSILIMLGYQFLSAQIANTPFKYPSQFETNKNNTSLSNKNVNQNGLIDPKKNKKFLLKTQQGCGSDGGQFTIHDTLFSDLKSLIKELSYIIYKSPKTELNLVAIEYHQKIDWNQFIEIIENIEFMPVHNAIGYTKSGRQVYKLMHYDLTKKRIYALEPFFEKYKEISDPSKKYILLTQLYRDILHETSHLFEIGIDNSKGNYDELSAEFSKKLYAKIMEYKDFCGLDGDIQEREENCRINGEKQIEFDRSIWTNIYYGPTKRISPQSKTELKTVIKIYWDKISNYMLTTNLSDKIYTQDKNPQAHCDQLNTSYGNKNRWIVPSTKEMDWILNTPLSNDNILNGLQVYVGMGSDSLNFCFMSINDKNQKIAVCPNNKYVNLSLLNPVSDYIKYRSRVALICIQRPNTKSYELYDTRLREMKTDWKGVVDDFFNSGNILD